MKSWPVICVTQWCKGTTWGRMGQRGNSPSPLPSPKGEGTLLFVMADTFRKATGGIRPGGVG